MKTKLAIILMLVVAVLVVAACGGSSPSTSAEAGSENVSTEFLGTSDQGGTTENYFAAFGHVANSYERESASKVLEENLRARAAHDWAGQCKSLSKEQVENLEARAKFLKGEKTCAKSLETEAEGAEPSVLADTMTGPIAVLRVEGSHGYALYHGAHHKNYAMQMVKEDGEWKVDHLVTFTIAKEKPKK